jgi:hypothetical protein
VNKAIDKMREHLIGTVVVKIGTIKDKTVNILYWPGYGIVMPAAMTTNGNVWAAAEFIHGQGVNKRQLEQMEPGTPVTVECTVLEGENFVELDHTKPVKEIREKLLNAAKQFDEVLE